jgi:hypothetical protein
MPRIRKRSQNLGFCFLGCVFFAFFAGFLLRALRLKAFQSLSRKERGGLGKTAEQTRYQDFLGEHE